MAGQNFELKLFELQLNYSRQCLRRQLELNKKRLPPIGSDIHVQRSSNITVSLNLDLPRNLMEFITYENHFEEINGT